MSFHVISVGCGLGSSFNEAIKRGHLFVPELKNAAIDKKQCLGIDKNDKFALDIVGQGHEFMCRDVAAEVEAIPEADYILVWNFLEHLPDFKSVTQVVHEVLNKAKKAAWFRLTNFDWGPEGMGQWTLGAINLRFAWYSQSQHTVKLKTSELVGLVKEYNLLFPGRNAKVEVMRGRNVTATDDPYIIPNTSPTDTKLYCPEIEEKYGKKPDVRFEEPLVANWECVVTFEGEQG